MIAALAWLKEHKQLAALAGLLVAVFVAGRASVRQPTVHAVEQEHAKADAKGQLDQTVHAGREKITITDYAAEPIQYAPPVLATGPSRGTLQTQAARNGAIPTDFCRPIVVPGQDRIIRQTVIERGASVTETHAQTEQHQELDRKLDLTVAPSALARSIALGAEDPFGARKLHLEAGVMVTDHVGVRVGWTPANGLLAGLTPMAEFRF
jgi:hypothetical protein